MISLMQGCQLAVVPASTIALEALMAKMLLLTGTTAGNQQNISSGISKYKGVENIGDFNLISKEDITKKLVALTQNFQPICFQVSDQMVGSNLLSVFNSLL